MNRSDVDVLTETVIDVIATTARLDRATLHSGTQLGSLGIQSLDVLEIIFDLETRLKVQVPDDAAEGLGQKTIGELAAMLSALTSTSQSP